MKKTLVTLALILTATTAQADFSNPLHKNLIEDLFANNAPLYVVTRQCGDNATARTLLKHTMAEAYKIAGKDEFSRKMTDITWMKYEVDAKGKVRRGFKKSMCPKVLTIVNDVIAIYK